MRRNTNHFGTGTIAVVPLIVVAFLSTVLFANL
jgi:hypothetical protein